MKSIKIDEDLHHKLKLEALKRKITLSELVKEKLCK